jgi:hypothetical protein
MPPLPNLLISLKFQSSKYYMVLNRSWVDGLCQDNFLAISPILKRGFQKLTITVWNVHKKMNLPF